MNQTEHTTDGTEPDNIIYKWIAMVVTMLIKKLLRKQKDVWSQTIPYALIPFIFTINRCSRPYKIPSRSEDPVELH